MYCSNDCKDKDQFHWLNCGRIPSEYNTRLEAGLKVCGNSDIMNNMLRKKDLITYTNIKNRASDKTIFDFEELNRDNCLTILASLEPFKYPTEFNELPDRPYYFTDFSEEQHDDMYQGLLHIFKITNANAIGFETMGREIKKEKLEIGFAVGLFGSLFNHSCDPNIMRISFEGKIVFMANRPIKAGEQLFITYSFNFPDAERIYRQKSLKGFNINCKCEACTNNWPTLRKLPKKIKNFEIPKPATYHENAESMLKQFKKNCGKLEEIWKFHPCFETAALIENNFYLFAELSKQKL